MQAYNRQLHEWFAKISAGEITLPRFQRWEAWDYGKVAGLLNTILDGLPAGATLILQVGDEEKFVSRPLHTAPEKAPRVTEQLLDGQQRLTSLWRSLNDTYRDSDHRTFLVQMPGGENGDSEVDGDKPASPEVISERIRLSKAGELLPSYLRTPESLWEKRRIPVSLLQPGDLNKEVSNWVREAIPNSEEADFDALEQARDELRETITTLRQKVREFNIPYLALPAATSKEVALDVFIKMNTSSVKLSTFDIVRALVESEAGESLNDLSEQLAESVPAAARYAPIEKLILDITALLQGRPANETGYKGINFQEMVENWSVLTEGLEAVVELLEQECIYDEHRLPSYPPVPVMAALLTMLPTQVDARGDARHLLKRYLWTSFLTNRYESSSSSRHFTDFKGLADRITGRDLNAKIPIFDNREYRPPSFDDVDLAGWPKKKGIIPRGLLALTFKCGALDIADGTPVSVSHVLKREYHHLFPDSTLREVGLEGHSFYLLNCVLIWWKANRAISNKDPIQYLRDRVDKSNLGESELQTRLKSHLVPFEELNVGTHADITDPEARKKAVEADYIRFCDARNKLFRVAAKLACEGETFTADRVFSEAAALGEIDDEEEENGE